jgi:DNA-binding NtrC family response regulator
MPVESPQKGRRALLIDDDPLVLRLLSRHLSRQGWVTVAADSAAQALRIFTAGMFDLVLSDVDLGDGTGGIVAARALRKIDPGLRVAMMSGEAANAAPVEKEGLGPLLQKPFEMSEIDALLQGRPQPRAAKA